MCGINGFNFNDRALILKMNALIEHRGPDDTGVHTSHGWSLGSNRLAIIDLSAAGHQPMETPDKRHVIVFNGEIYNFEAIKEELRSLGHSFVSKSDTEVILHAYQEWGTACFKRLNGIFGLAILDTETNELVLARDHVGVKPVYYCHVNGVFAFSSEAKALLEHKVSNELDLAAVNTYFRMLYVPSPLTAWKDIRKLPPGHFATVKGGAVHIERYWSVEEKPLMTDHTRAVREVKELLEDSVRGQMISDRPIGVFLSGGIDSTVIAGIMKKLSGHVQSFSVGFAETPESKKYNNDAVIARKTAAHFGTEHHELTVSAKDVADNLERSLYFMDEPISNHVQTVNMLLARFVQKTVTVVLGGDGGDELFGGYERYYYNRLIDRARMVPGASFLHPMFKTAPGTTRYLSFFAQKEDLVGSFLKPPFNDATATPALYEKLFFQSIDRQDFTRQMMRTDIQSWLPDESLMRSDKMSMAASLEQRVPFLDYRLVELADRIPTAFKIGSKSLFSKAGQGYRGKVILKEACAEYLPDFVLAQPKWGWFSPAAKWIRNELKEFVREVLSPSYTHGTKDMFDWEAVERILDDHLTQKKYALNTIWSLMTFQVWHRQFIEGKART